jgi:hypothetical protein
MPEKAKAEAPAPPVPPAAAPAMTPEQAAKAEKEAEKAESKQQSEIKKGMPKEVQENATDSTGKVHGSRTVHGAVHAVQDIAPAMPDPSGSGYPVGTQVNPGDDKAAKEAAEKAKQESPEE